MKTEPSKSSENFSNHIGKVFNEFFQPISVSSTKEEAMRSNRNMLHQLVSREDVRELLNVDEDKIRVPLWRTILYPILLGGMSVAMFRRPLFVIVGFIVAFLIFVIDWSILRKNYPKKVYSKIREIAGSEEHFMVLEGMLGATGYQNVSTWKHKSSMSDSDEARMRWFVSELKNFVQKDREARLKDNMKDNEGSMKVDLLRNIHSKTD